MQGRWIAISAARARAHRLYGVRGWLVTLLWLNTLPVLVVVLAMAMVLMSGETGGGAARSLPPLAGLVFPLGLVVVAFLRVRWFPWVWLGYCLLQLFATLGMSGGIRAWAVQASGAASAGLPLALLLAAEVLVPIGTLAYLARSRRVRVTYRHEVRASDPAAAPAVFDRLNANETPSDATDHARERAALRRVTQELSSGVLDTQTWMHVMRHHADATDGTRTTAYVRARMAVLCPPAHVHPPLVRTLASGVGALVVSLVAAGALMAAVIALALSLPGDATALLEACVAVALTLSWLAGLFVGARFLRAIA
ncbi:MAG: hypothetical protein QM625_19845 [Ralstonia sp.]|uniref:Transmembrane protein n=1 Tax=Ralstonia pickettii TaxID=329 RepID=A0A9Q3LMS9_RALPI|nr:hypothetical protein [Ralstonia pickettii]MBA9844013.1 hypothetical protein [Ralstonia pickettii]MBA9849783.1 hypothetical protein [Ralstonia pickettii]MBA9876806.1 hypothetical protein [Ralstonia pickettii]MBA9880650.1 hypothetical protein [Ralstonia pickettii]MBA9886614.1 hypothetical protein [Ralstonia pickettii]